ncbi:hypothetical protein HEB29_005598 [Streptomyces fulvorobeus]|uniref:Uncharacterized protein n=1 Tax=Streptomyces fulvorobeus TaxID=284028 RepID=A0A7Y9HHW8_9ACTN|nr:hypothetical protein [Streptomyces fulvorobeus]
MRVTQGRARENAAKRHMSSTARLPLACTEMAESAEVWAYAAPVFDGESYSSYTPDAIMPKNTRN